VQRGDSDRWVLGGRERLRGDDARHQIAPVVVRCCTGEDGSNSEPGSGTKRPHGLAGSIPAEPDDRRRSLKVMLM
jgi:hypothetical protein